MMHVISHILLGFTVSILGGFQDLEWIKRWITWSDLIACPAFSRRLYSWGLLQLEFSYDFMIMPVINYAERETHCICFSHQYLKWSMNIYELIGYLVSKNILMSYRTYKIDAGNLTVVKRIHMFSFLFLA